VLMSSVEVAEPPGDGVTLIGQTDTTGPLGSVEMLRDTADERPPRLVMVTVEVDEELANVSETLGVLVEMLKSWTVVVTVVVWTSAPLVPVIVIV